MLFRSKSLRVTSLLFPLSQVFKLICSLPLLEDLDLIGCDEWAVSDDNLRTPSTVVPLTSPAFTGTLQLHLGMTSTAHRLLDLPNGLLFRKLNLSWHNAEELRWAVMLVVACSGTPNASMPHMIQMVPILLLCCISDLTSICR